MAEVANLMGRVFHETGDYHSSEEMFLLSLRVRDSLGRIDDYYALTLNNLAMLYMSTEKYSEADSVLDKAVKIYEEMGATNSLQMAAVLRNKSSVAASTGKFEDAEHYRLRALHIYEQTIGPHTIPVLRVLESLLDLYTKTNREQEAVAIEVRIRQLKAANATI